jgi:hypothetical protein
LIIPPNLSALRLNIRLGDDPLAQTVLKGIQTPLSEELEPLLLQQAPKTQTPVLLPLLQSEVVSQSWVHLTISKQTFPPDLRWPHAHWPVESLLDVGQAKYLKLPQVAPLLQP